MSIPHHSQERFPSTRWSLVIEAQGGDVAAALEELSRLYWLPLYAYARRRGLDPEDAEDLTQDFFVKLVEDREKLLRDLDPVHGRLRTFLLTVMKRRIVDWRRRRLRQKRGGGSSALGIEVAEALLAEQAEGDATPERSYDRQWALAILDLALGRLERDYGALEREAEFNVMRPFLGMGEEAPQDYEGVVASLAISRESARQKVHRFRERFRNALRSEIADTLRTPDDASIDLELQELQEALR